MIHSLLKCVCSFLLLSTVLAPVRQVNAMVIIGKIPAGADSEPVVRSGTFSYQTIDVEISGLVTDSAGAPLAGVSVYAKENQKIGTTTDLNGRYILRMPENSTLVIGMVGFISQEVPVRGRKTIDVILLRSNDVLEETVVVAFGKQKRENVVGAVTTIRPGELKVPSSNLTTALAGRLAGVIAYQRSGEPGLDNADFFIRGVTTFGYKQDPLILVDGIELSATDLARLQVDDIASFSILKDATASALYGARGANGVILITTKEGVEGKVKINVRLENSISAPTREIELADPVTYMKLNNEAVITRNPLGSEPYSLSKIDNTIHGTDSYAFPVTHWQDVLFKDRTMNQRANMNVSGGGKVARYYFAATFNQDNGILNVDKRNNFNNNIDLKTFGLRANVNVNLTRTTEAGVRLYGTFDDYNGPIGGGAEFYRKALKSDPVSFPAYYPKDSAHVFVNHILFGNSSQGLINPYADMVKGYQQYNQNLMLAQFDLKQDLSFITKGMRLQALFNTTRYSYFSVSRSYSPYFYELGLYDKMTGEYSLLPLNPDGGTEYLTYNEGPKQVRATTYIQAMVNYDRLFNDKHNVTGLLVFLMQNRLDGNAGSLETSLPHRNLGVSGRSAYAYDKRYFFEFNFGYNGSERFYETNRWGFFPSVGVAWQVSNEKFWAPLREVAGSLKVRATYGLIGNDAIGEAGDRFFYLSEVNMDDARKGATFGLENVYHRNGVTVNRYSDPAISWEVSYKTNLGFDLNLFNRANISADFWTEKRTRILMKRSDIPTTVGLNDNAVPNSSIGKAEGRGIDISLDYLHVFSPKLWMQGRANFTYATTNFLVYEEPEYAGAPWRSRVGYPISQQWGYIAERLFVDDKEVANMPAQNFGVVPQGGDIKYRDVNGDGRISSLDQVPIGHPASPAVVYGFGVSVGYQNFDLSCFFQGLAQESFWINASAVTPFALGTSGSQSTKNQLLNAIAQDRWSESNQDLYAFWPRLSPTVNPNNTQRSTWFMRDGAFLRLKNVELGYSLPERTIKRINATKARIYLSATNLFVWSRFKLWDVEMAGNGLGYPVQRVINMGAQISF